MYKNKIPLKQYIEEHPITSHYNKKVPKILRGKMTDNFFHISQMIAFLYGLPKKFTFTDIMRSLEVQRWFRMSSQWIENIPKSWPLVIVANHPHILVDQFAIGSLLESIRPQSEIKIITDNTPEGFEDIYPYSERVGKTPEAKQVFRDNINSLLKNNGTVIIFPSGKLTYRHFFTGEIIEDRWRSGALHFARYAQAPILPIFISSKTTAIYNLCSNFFSRQTMQWLNFRQALKKEMYIGLSVWEALIPSDNISPEDLRDIVYELWNENYILKEKK